MINIAETENPLRIILLDDESTVLDQLSKSADRAKIDVEITATEDPYKFRKLCVERRGFYDFAIMDINLSDGETSLEKFENDIQFWNALPVIILTQHADVNYRIKALALGACGYYRKPQVTSFWESAVFIFKNNARLNQRRREDMLRIASDKKTIVGGLIHQMKAARTEFKELKNILEQLPRSGEGVIDVKQHTELDNYAGSAISRIVEVEDVIEHFSSWAVKAEEPAEPKNCNVLTLIDRAVKKVGIEYSGINYVVSGTDLTCAIDEEKIYTVVLNLLENASRFTSSAKPRVEIEAAILRIESKNIDLLEIRVRDFGPGVDVNIDDIYEEFRFGPESKGVGGLGLGLSICKRMCRCHCLNGFCGTIFHENMNTGVTFTVSIPTIKQNKP